MQSSLSSVRRHQVAESFVAELMKSRGWRVDASSSGDGGADLVLERHGQRYAVEIKSLAEGRADRALPLLSLAILQARAHAKSIADAQPLAVLMVGQASSNLANHLRSFAEDYAEGVTVGIVSEDGFRHFVGSPFEELNAEPKSAKWPAARSSHQVVNLFSDLNQWMLKLLLANEIPEHLLSAPRINCRSGSELAAAAGASAMSASRFLQQLRVEGFLDEPANGPCLVRRREMHMRFVLRAPVRDQVRDLIAKQSGDACLALFAAADALQFGHVSGVPTYVYVPKMPTSEDRQWRSVRPLSSGETPDLILRQAAFPESTFRGAVHQGKESVTDVIQTWLDVGSHPARGAEQADLIYDKFLRQVIEGMAR
jgi:hypothetical protein